jgi:hypothetical protein
VAKLVTGQDFVFGYNIAATPTTVDTFFTCSMECPHVIVNTDLALMTWSHVGVLRPLCRALDTYFLGDGGCGWPIDLSHGDLRLLIPVHGDTTADPKWIEGQLSLFWLLLMELSRDIGI